MPSEQESTPPPESQQEKPESSQAEMENPLAPEEIELYQKKVEQFVELSDPNELYNVAENLIDDFREIRQGVDERTSRRIFLRIYTTLKEASSARGFSTFEELDLAAQLARLRRKAPDLVDLAEEAVAIRNGNKDSGFEESENKILEEESENRSEEPSEELVGPPERYYQDVEEVCAELVEIIEKGEAELAAKKLKPFEARVDGKSYYQELLQQEEIVRMVRDKVLENINSDTSLRSKEAAHLKLGIEDLAAGVLGKAHLFRQETLIPNYFNFDQINYIVDTISKNEDYTNGRRNPRKAEAGGVERDLVDLFEEFRSLLETGLSFDLAEEDEKLIEKKLTEVRAIYQDLKQAEEYHQDLLDFENNPQNTEARQLSETVINRRQTIEAWGVEQRARAKLSWPKTRLEQLANHQQRLDDRIKILDDASVVKEEATRLLEEVVSARQAAKEIFELIETAQLSVYEQRKEIVDLMDKTREVLAEDVETVRGDKNQTSRLETLQKELQTAKQAAQAANLLSDADAAVYEGNKKVGSKINELTNALQEASDYVNELIEATKILKGTDLIEKKYFQLRETFATSGDTSQVELRREILDLVEKLGGEKERNRWLSIMHLWDASVEAASTAPEANNNFSDQLNFSNEIEAWIAVNKNINLAEMRELINSDPNLIHALKIIELIMEGGSDYFSSVDNYIKQNNLSPTQFFQQNAQKLCKYNYTKNGQPGEASLGKGYLKLEALIKEILPDVTNYVPTLAVDVITLTGLRSKAYLPYCWGYVSSPKAENGVKGVAEAVAPLAYIMYYVRKNGWLPIKLRDVALYYNPQQSYSGPDRETVLQRYGSSGEDPNAPVVAGEHVRNSYNVDSWIKFRDWLTRLITENKELHKYQYNQGKPIDLSEWTEDIQIFPTPWDLLWIEPSKLGDFKFTEYLSNLGTWVDFLEFVSSLKNLKIRKEEVDGAIPALLRTLGDNTSGIKGFMGSLKQTEYFERYKPLINFLHLVAIKRIFDLYHQADSLNHPNRLLSYFQKKFLRMLRESNLLKGEVQDFIQSFVIQNLSELTNFTRSIYSQPPYAVYALQSVIRDRFNPDDVAEFRKLTSGKPPEEAEND